MTTEEISPYDDLINSGDVIARIAELQRKSDRIQELQSALDGGRQEPLTPEESTELDDLLIEFESGEEEELSNLKELASWGEYLSGWGNGDVTLISDSYIEEYARNFASEIHGGADTSAWPFSCVDWSEAVSEMLEDYKEIDFAGETFWGRL